MGNSNVTTMLLIVLCLEFVLLLGQIAIVNINPDSSATLFKNNSLYGEFTTADGTMINSTLQDDALPSANPGVNVDTSEFTDSITSVRSWAYGGVGQRILATLFFGPATYLSYTNAPEEFVTALAGLWVVMILWLVMGLFLGRNT